MIESKEQVIKRYFKSWIVPNFEDFEDTFSKNASYSECYGQLRIFELIMKWLLLNGILNVIIEIKLVSLMVYQLLNLMK